MVQIHNGKKDNENNKERDNGIRKKEEKPEQHIHQALEEILSRPVTTLFLQRHLSPKKTQKTFGVLASMGITTIKDLAVARKENIERNLENSENEIIVALEKELLRFGLMIGTTNEKRRELIEHLQTPVSETSISTRGQVRFSDKYGDDMTICELAQKKEGDLLKIRNYGRRSLKQDKGVLKKIGLYLDLEFDPVFLEEIEGNEIATFAFFPESEQGVRGTRQTLEEILSSPLTILNLQKHMDTQKAQTMFTVLTAVDITTVKDVVAQEKKIIETSLFFLGNEAIIGLEKELLRFGLLIGMTEEKRRKLKEHLRTPVLELSISTRSRNCIMNTYGENTRVVELAQKTDKQLLDELANYGPTSHDEVKEVIEDMSLYLGLEFDPVFLEEIEEDIYYDRQATMALLPRLEQPVDNFFQGETAIYLKSLELRRMIDVIQVSTGIQHDEVFLEISLKIRRRLRQEGLYIGMKLDKNVVGDKEKDGSLHGLEQEEIKGPSVREAIILETNMSLGGVNELVEGAKQELDMLLKKVGAEGEGKIKEVLELFRFPKQ